jgi:hypothetical protein
MQQTLNSAQFSGYDSFKVPNDLNPSQKKMAETASMMQLGIPRNGINADR